MFTSSCFVLRRPTGPREPECGKDPRLSVVRLVTLSEGLGNRSRTISSASLCGGGARRGQIKERSQGNVLTDLVLPKRDQRAGRTDQLRDVRARDRPGRQHRLDAVPEGPDPERHAEEGGRQEGVAAAVHGDDPGPAVLASVLHEVDELQVGDAEAQAVGRGG